MRPRLISAMLMWCWFLRSRGDAPKHAVPPLARRCAFRATTIATVIPGSSARAEMRLIRLSRVVSRLWFLRSRGDAPAVDGRSDAPGGGLCSRGDAPTTLFDVSGLSWVPPLARRCAARGLLVTAWSYGSSARAEMRLGVSCKRLCAWLFLRSRGDAPYLSIAVLNFFTGSSARAEMRPPWRAEARCDPSVGMCDAFRSSLIMPQARSAERQAEQCHGPKEPNERMSLRTSHHASSASTDDATGNLGSVQMCIELRRGIRRRTARVGPSGVKRSSIEGDAAVRAWADHRAGGGAHPLFDMAHRPRPSRAFEFGGRRRTCRRIPYCVVSRGTWSMAGPEIDIRSRPNEVHAGRDEHIYRDGAHELVVNPELTPGPIGELQERRPSRVSWSDPHRVIERTQHEGGTGEGSMGGRDDHRKGSLRADRWTTEAERQHLGAGRKAAKDEEIRMFIAQELFGFTSRKQRHDHGLALSVFVGIVGKHDRPNGCSKSLNHSVDSRGGMGTPSQPGQRMGKALRG